MSNARPDDTLSPIELAEKKWTIACEMPKKNEFGFDFNNVLHATKEPSCNELCNYIQEQMNLCCKQQNWISIATNGYTEEELEEALGVLQNEAKKANIKTERMRLDRNIRIFFYKL